MERLRAMARVHGGRPWVQAARLFAIVFVLLLSAQSEASDNILILNSYHRGKLLSDQTIDAIVTELQEEHPKLTFLIEDMDTKRRSLNEVRASLLNLYKQKYQATELRAVITVDNNAFEFAIENRDTLFPGIPLVFCGFNGFKHSVLDGLEGVTGVAEAIDMESTVNVALALHPNTTHLAVVSDTTPTGAGILRDFRAYAKQLPKSLKIVELFDVTSDQLRARLKALPTSSVILRFSFFRDADGQSFRVDEQVGLIAEAGLPVYDFWDEGGIGSGYVGGYVVSGTSQGQVVARMVERILAGEAPDRIKVVDRSPNIPVFDKRELIRTRADLSQLPPNSEVRFAEISFLSQYQRQLLIGIGITFVVLSSLAVFFAVLSVQRNELGRGTAFVIRLPLADQLAAQAAEPEHPIPGEGVVLVVDDDNFLQCMAKETLEDLGYEVLTAGDGQQAIEVYERAMGRIDIVLLDMSMPRMNGTDCFVELRRLDPNVRVVVTSGHSSADVQEKMTELGMTIQLPKPYQRAELSKALSFAVR